MYEPSQLNILRRKSRPPFATAHKKWKYYDYNVYLNRHILGFHPHTQKVNLYSRVLSVFVFSRATKKWCLVAVISVVTLRDFIYRLKSQKEIVGHIKLYHSKALKAFSGKDFVYKCSKQKQLLRRSKVHHRKIPLNSLDLNLHTLSFHLQIQTSESPCTA